MPEQYRVGETLAARWEYTEARRQFAPTVRRLHITDYILRGLCTALVLMATAGAIELGHDLGSPIMRWVVSPVLYIGLAWLPGRVASPTLHGVATAVTAGVAAKFCPLGGVLHDASVRWFPEHHARWCLAPDDMLVTRSSLGWWLFGPLVVAGIYMAIRGWSRSRQTRRWLNHTPPRSP